jgi:hypothetical protein
LYDASKTVVPADYFLAARSVYSGLRGSLQFFDQDFVIGIDADVAGDLHGLLRDLTR